MKIFAPSRSAVVASLVVTLLGCGGQGDHTGPTSSEVIGPSGGAVSAVTGPLAGANVTIPPGALAGPATVSIQDAASVTTADFIEVGPPFLVTADGAALVASAIVNVPATPPSGRPASDLVVLLQTGTGVTVLAPASGGGNVLSVTTGELGIFQAAIAPPIDLATSTMTVDKATEPADGVSIATITIVIVDATGVPVSGAQVTLAATGSNDTIVQPQPTDPTGTTTGTIASTTPETKTITASVSAPPLINTSATLGATVTVEFQ